MTNGWIVPEATDNKPKETPKKGETPIYDELRKKIYGDK